MTKDVAAPAATYVNRLRAVLRNWFTPFWTEGNALWWEMLFWDLGYPRTPEERMGMLFWRMHRCARIIFSLSYHLGTMTPTLRTCRQTRF